MITRILGWRRLVAMAAAALLVSVIVLPTWQAEYSLLIGRLLFAGILVLGVFGLFEHWPRRLPKWLARWALQVIAVALAVPFAVMAAYFVSTVGDAVPWYLTGTRITGFAFMSILGALIGSWFAIIALLRQVSGRAERQALEARLRLLQSQVEPHFLFNTLANVRELVDTGSPQASKVLGSLITYLRDAVPLLHDTTSTLRAELDLVRAYLEVMRMRMPDRLDFTIDADPAALDLSCPSTTLLTLVENAVRHGIDPGEEGGHIDVRVELRGDRCNIRVSDTGVGLVPGRSGLGTGLANLRERLELMLGGDTQLRLIPLEPQGACAEIEFPARWAAT